MPLYDAGCYTALPHKSCQILRLFVGRLPFSLQICAALAILAAALKEKASGQTVLPAYAISDSAADTIVDIAATVGASYLIVAAPQRNMLVNLLRGNIIRNISSHSARRNPPLGLCLKERQKLPEIAGQRRRIKCRKRVSGLVPRYSFKIGDKFPYVTHHLVSYLRLHSRLDRQPHYAQPTHANLDDDPARYRRINCWRSDSSTVFETSRRLSLSPGGIDSLDYWRNYCSFHLWQNFGLEQALVQAAAREVIVAGYSIYNGKTVFKPLAERMDSIPDLQVTFLVHVGREGKDTTIETDLVAQYAKRFVSDNWPGQRLPDMYYDPRGLQMAAAMRSNFHPKCLLVDGEEALVTSANFTMAAQKKNVEVGVKIKAPILVARLRTYFLSLVERGDLKRVYLPTDSR